MAEEDIVRSIRKDEYKEAILTWRHLQNVRYAIIGASITGFVGLIGAFQLAFPRDVPSIEMGTAAVSNPRLYVIGIIPIAGMILGAAGALSLIEWYWDRLKLLRFAEALEDELKIVTPILKKRRGFFTAGTAGNGVMFMGSFGFSFILLLVSVWAWYGVLGQVNAYKAQLPRSVIIETIPSDAPSPVSPEKEK